LHLAQALGRDDLVALALSGLGLADSSDGNLTGSLLRYQDAFALAQPRSLEPLRSGVELSGLILYWRGRYDEAVQNSQQALDLAQPTYDSTTTARALANLGLALTGQGQYAEAITTFDQARRFAQEQGTREWLARATSMCGGLYLEVNDFAQAEALAEEARELSASLGWPLARVSSDIDLLFNYARRHEIGRTERLLGEVAAAAVDAQGAHGWLWRMRLAAVRGEIALARDAYEDALRAAKDAERQARACGRMKYEALALETRAQALTRLGRKHEALQAAQRAITLVRPTGDPALLLRATTVHLAIEGNDVLFAEAQAARERIARGLPEGDARQRFLAAASTPLSRLDAPPGRRDR
jgi:tetratricopeptide (TPR) repeat protein